MDSRFYAKNIQYSKNVSAKMNSHLSRTIIANLKSLTDFI